MTVATYRDAAYLRQADKYLATAINAEARKNMKFCEHALSRACLHELVGLGYCSLIRIKPKFERVGPNYELQPIDGVAQDAPHRPDVIEGTIKVPDYIDFGPKQYKQVSACVH